MGKIPKKYWALCIYVALALSTFAVFWQVRHHEFISFDDDLYIFNNSYVKAGLTREGLVWAFTKTHAYNWHPLTWVSHMLDCEFYGLEAGGHHFTNVLFHVANALLLLSVLKRMTGSLYSSAFVAALFALHPLHVESVAWASERKDVLSTFFWILTMWAYVQYAERPNIARYLLTVLALCLGLMAKQMLVTLPFVLLLLDYWPLGRFTFKGQSFCNSAGTVVSVSARRCILEKIPLLILSVVASMIVYFVQHYVGTVKSFIEYSLFYRIGNAMVAYAVYIGKMLWPTNLAIFYPHRYESLLTWQITGAALLLVCVTTAALWKIRQKPYLAVGWLWYLGTLVPVIGLVQVGLQAYADRYTYMTLTGLFMIIAWGIPDILARLHYRKAFLSVSAALLLLVLGVMAWHQVRHWRNNITLYRHAAVVVQDNWWAHNALGKALESQGKLDEAVAHFTEALRIDPGYLNPRENIGKVYLAQGRYDEAIKCFNEVLIFEKDWFDLHYSLGVAYTQLGNYGQAIIHLTEAVELKPNFVWALNNLAWFLATMEDTKLRNPADAVKYAQRACELSNYEHPGVLDTLAVAYAAAGNFPEAVKTAEKAIKLAEAADEKDLAKEIQERLYLYKSDQPYRER